MAKTKKNTDEYTLNDVIKIMRMLSRAVRKNGEIKIADSFAEAFDRAAELLKEQAPIQPITASDHDRPDGSLWFVCPACRIAIDYKDKFCRHCGRQMIWEEEGAMNG